MSWGKGLLGRVLDIGMVYSRYRIYNNTIDRWMHGWIDTWMEECREGWREGCVAQILLGSQFSPRNTPQPSALNKRVLIFTRNFS